MDIEKNKATVRTVFEQGFGEGRLEVVDEALADDADDRHPFGPDEPDMRAHLKNAIRMFRAGIPDLSVKVADLIAEGDKVAARVLMTGTHTGAAVFGIAATGRPVSIEQFHVVQLDEAGLGLHHWANVGEDQLRQQLLGTAV
jgi:predicted ester cyclase